MKPKLHGEVTIEIPFHDVDALGVVWHGHYVKYMEIARTAMLRKVGLDIPQLRSTGCGWVVAECHLKFIRPMFYGMKVRIETTLLEYETRVKIGYLMTNADTGERLNKAWTTHLAVNLETGELQYHLPSFFGPSQES